LFRHLGLDSRPISFFQVSPPNYILIYLFMWVLH